MSIFNPEEDVKALTPLVDHAIDRLKNEVVPAALAGAEAAAAKVLENMSLVCWGPTGDRMTIKANVTRTGPKKEEKEGG